MWALSREHDAARIRVGAVRFAHFGRALYAATVALALAFTGCADDGDDGGDPVPVAPGIFGALGDPLPTATAEQLVTFERGLEVVQRRFAPENGLGPRFNVSFCGACHEKPVFGGVAGRYRDFYLTASLLSDGSFITPPGAGVEHAYGVGDAPVRPSIDGDWNVQARRNPVPLFGVGLIAEIPEAVILANADPDDDDNDGISGRPNWDDGFVGRFGRKAQTVDIEGFIRGPLNNHAGITSDPLTDAQRALLPVDSSDAANEARLDLQVAPLRLRRQAQAAPPSEPLFDEDDVRDPELSQQDLFDVVSFTMLLAAPQPSPPTAESLRGETHFHEIGCASCHIPALEGPRGMIPLYSDLLLHDMGPAMDDGIRMGVATGSEFRTQPLWGIAAVAPYLHDGRADTLDEAIRWHGGEGQASRDAYVALLPEAQRDLIAFLESLGGIEQRSDGMLPPTSDVPAVGTLGGPLRALDHDEASIFFEGRRLFDRDVHISEGLGPHFNGDSCRACHFDPVLGGAGPIDVNVIRFGTLDATTGGFVAPTEGTILPKFTLPGVRRVEPSGESTFFEARQTPHVFGLGLIEAIPVETIMALADPDDADGDGVRGVPHVLPGGRLGRFGWKAQVPTVREFVRDALSAEVGVTVPDEPGHTFGASTDDDDAPDPEFTSVDIDALEFFLLQLAPPPLRGEHPRGERVFDDIGCATCHTPTLDSPLGPVHLYSNLLLHDVAPDGARGVPDGAADERLFRTPPLWGLGDSAPYMHNGLASTIEAAIRAHFGEAAASAARFETLSNEDRRALLDFLGSL